MKIDEILVTTGIICCVVSFLMLFIRGHWIIDSYFYIGIGFYAGGIGLMLLASLVVKFT